MPEASLHQLLVQLEFQLGALRQARWAAIDPHHYETSMADYKQLADATRVVEEAIGQLRPLLTPPNPSSVETLPPDVTGPHLLSDDFTDTRPAAFAWETAVYTHQHGLSRRTHRAVYEWVLRRLWQQDPVRLRACIGAARFESREHHPDFATKSAPLRAAWKLAPGFYAEVNLSANEFAARLRLLLAHYGLPPDTLRLWVQSAPPPGAAD